MTLLLAANIMYFDAKVKGVWGGSARKHAIHHWWTLLDSVIWVTFSPEHRNFYCQRQHQNPTLIFFLFSLFSSQFCLISCIYGMYLFTVFTCFCDFFCLWQEVKMMSSCYFCYQSLIYGQSKSIVFCVLNEAKNLKGTEATVPMLRLL